jgi:acyl-[acyl-carrier-protein]-phospholipid O-acyltransferase/long-chain-fatty-acid--[acyl-carrier-protein] ligase
MLAALLSSRRFAPLFWCQFLSAFNDNFIKQSLIILALYGVGTTAPVENAASLVTLATAMLVLPALLLSGVAGQIADRFDKAVVARRVKFAEIFVVLAAAAGFALHSVPILMACILGLGIMAALFGPIKYGILPDHLKIEELPAGNALIEGGTFLSILLGILAGGFAPAVIDSSVIAAIMVAMALLCWATAALIPRTGEAAPTLRINPNIVVSTRDLLRHIASDRRLLGGSIAVAWFWMVGAVVLSLVPALARDTMGGDQSVATVFLTAFSIGIGIGSILAARLVAGRIILVLGPIGCLLMGLVGLDIAWVAAHASHGSGLMDLRQFLASAGGLRLTIDLVLLAIAAGLFIVPVFAAVQAWAEKEQRARVIAGVNVLSALFMSVGAGILAALQSAGVSTPTLLLGVALLNLLAGLAFFRILPMSGLRDFILMLYRLLFRLEVRGIANLQASTAPRIIAINHVSFLDAGLMLALLDEDPVFAIDQTIARTWWVKPFLKLARAYPLDPSKPMATRALIHAVKAGETLVIFPEGRLTVTGSLMKIYDGAGLIADKSEAAVVPVRIEGLERTPFSRLSRRQVNRRWLPKVTVTFLPAARLSVNPELRGKKRRQAAGAALYDIMSDLVFRTAPTEQTIFQAFAAAAERYRSSRVILEDPVTGALTYKRALAAVAVLADKLVPLTRKGEAVGVLLPNANAVALTVLALHSTGRVPAMLNYTAGAANVLSACQAAEVKTVIASRAFVERGRLQALVAAIETVARLVWLEDVRASVSFGDRLKGLLRAGHQRVRTSPDDAAAILFTSGSEGTPKGVVLTHRNILSNCAQVAARIDFGPGDILFNVLPVFHSFGLTGGMILPLISGVKLYLYPSPLHYRIIPELVYASNATVMFGTDTFLAGYARSANPYDFRSLRYVLAGAEPVRADTRRIYNEKFGLRILEGYGVTETSPVLAVNTPMFNRNGTVGRILPGMEARLDAVPGITDGGRLFVRGPNVMAGYLRAEAPGAIDPPADGWHDTGDIVVIDPDGFVTIKGRAKRFAKIAGEMVSLAAAEQTVADLWPDAATAVLAAPDDRKGERLVLVTTQPGATRQEVAAHLRAKRLPELMAPAEVIVVERMPVLGSGKTDYVALNALLRDRSSAAA